MKRKEGIIWAMITLWAITLSVAFCGLLSDHTHERAHTACEYSQETPGCGLEFDCATPTHELQTRMRAKVHTSRILPQDAPTYAKTSSAICKSEISDNRKTEHCILDQEPKAHYLTAKRSMLYPLHSFL